MSTQRGIVRAHARTGWALAGLLVASLHSPRANALLTDEIFASGFAATVTYYVAKNGDDTWRGTLPAPNDAKTDGPFATFDHARNAVQALDKTDIERVFVTFRDGTYALTTAEQFTAADSGSVTTEIDGTFAADPEAFHVQLAGTMNGPCTGNTSFWTYYHFDTSSPSWLADVGEDAGSVIQDPGFANPDFPHDDFSLIGAAPVGFVPFDLSASGRKNAPFTPPAVDPTFTIAPRDPATNF